MNDLTPPVIPTIPTSLIVYIDEAGRGPIAGPVTVGLVIGSELTDRSGYADSKSLTARQRELLAHKIKSDSSIIRATGSASAKEIDRNGIIWALRWAVIRGLYRLVRLVIARHEAIQGVGSQGKQCYHKKLIKDIKSLAFRLSPLALIIDGNHTFGLDTELGITVKTYSVAEFKGHFWS